MKAKYGGEILAWQPETGVAVLQLSPKETERVRAESLAGKVSQQAVAIEPKASVTSPEVEAQGSNAWAGGGMLGRGGSTSALPGTLPGQNALSWYQISLYRAHGISRKFGAGVKVAVIDTGLDLTHPMFKNRLAPATEWRDFIDNDNNPQEVSGGKSYGHGTAVAGLILQVAPRTTILPIRVLGSDGRGDTARIISAIDYAIGAGAQVINLSLGTNGWTSALYTICGAAKQKGVRIVASSGNNGMKDGITSPAQYSWSPDTVGFSFGIGSVDANDNLSSFSNYGAALYATAPGEKLYTAFPDKQVATSTGTSFAAPLFTGAIALAYSEMPNAADRANLQTYLWNSLDFTVNQKNKGKSTNVQRLNLEKLIRNLPGFTLPTQIQPGDYGLVNTNSRKCLDVSGASTSSGEQRGQRAAVDLPRRSQPKMAYRAGG